jgi:hypothetical protein
VRGERLHRQVLPCGIMFGAGTLSGLLGMGSGAVKVLAMDHAMKLPFKVSTTMSNFMIGVTAAASAGIYLSRGYIDPGIAMPVMLGALVGSLVGARILVVSSHVAQSSIQFGHHRAWRRDDLQRVARKNLMTPITDKQLESAIADMLRVGVVLAAIVVFVGAQCICTIRPLHGRTTLIFMPRLPHCAPLPESFAECRSLTPKV